MAGRSNFYARLMDSLRLTSVGVPITASGEQSRRGIGLAGLLTLAAVAAVIFATYPAGDFRRWFALLILAAFAGISEFLSGLRRRINGHLYIALLVLLVVGLILLRVEPFAWIVLFFIISADALHVLPRREGYAWTIVCGLITIATFYTWTNDVAYSLILGLGATGGYLFVASSTEVRKAADRANRESRRLLTDLQDAHRQLQLYAAQVEELAVAEERNRLAREMHDTLGHRLTVAAVQLEGAQRLAPRDGERAAAIVGTVREEIVDGLNELRRVVARLRTPLEAELPLPLALPRLTDSFAAATELSVLLQIDEPFPDLPSFHRHALHRAVQEALTNAQKHSRAGTVWIDLSQQGDADGRYVQLQIDDDGDGLDSGNLLDGFGLRGMRERTEMLDGRMTLVGRGERGGVSIVVTLPLPADAMDDPDERALTEATNDEREPAFHTGGG